MAEHNDEFFINLEMTFDEKDEQLYVEWATWCTKSNNTYYIDSKVVDGKVTYFTKVRTDAEVAEILTELAPISEEDEPVLKIQPRIK